MNAGIVVQNDFPHGREVRARKLAGTLHSSGHTAFILSANSGERGVAETLEDAKVLRFPYLVRSAVFRAFAQPSPFNPLWAYWIARAVRRNDIHVLIASNIRIAFPAIMAAKLLRIPIVLDLQENNPAAVHLREKTNPAHLVTRSRAFVRWLERRSIDWANHVWVVIDERWQDLVDQGADGAKMSVISNVPVLSKLEDRNRTDHDRAFTLVYVGGIQRIRGLEVIINALPHVAQQDLDVMFLVVGDGEERANLERLTSELGIREMVHFTGWVDPSSIYQWILKGDVGVIPHQVNRFTDTTIPNKLFDYMTMGVPILATDMDPVRRIIVAEDCGRIIPENAREGKVAEIILDMKNDPEERFRMGERGRRAVEERYNWRLEGERALRDLLALVSSAGETA